jgi:hypothetical protein
MYLGPSCWLLAAGSCSWQLLVAAGAAVVLVLVLAAGCWLLELELLFLSAASLVSCVLFPLLNSSVT